MPVIFLIHYDRSTRILVSIVPFENREAASKAKINKELELLHLSNGHEVVLLESESEESLRSTHRRYFESLSDIKSRETEAYSSSKPKFVKHWTVKLVKGGWLVQAEGVPGAVYPSKENAIGAASKDAKDWAKSTGNATSVRIWADDGTYQEITSGSE